VADLLDELVFPRFDHSVRVASRDRSWQSSLMVENLDAGVSPTSLPLRPVLLYSGG
jgi:hypothetical protein